MRWNSKTSALLVGGAVLAAAAGAYALADSRNELQTVTKIDLSRYVGRWYEIARYPNRFQKKCTGDTSATYSLLPEGDVQVVNACKKQDGSLDEAKGKAKIVDKQSNAKLKVSFFWPFYGAYWIIGLDPEYRWAVVGHPDRKYLWILSRSPQMKDSDYDEALRVIRAKGYDESRLLKTPQSAR
jgi:apolipoprotein D and lipocalin family protein